MKSPEFPVWKRRLRLAGFLFLGLALLAGGALVWKRKDLREWRARELARQALTALAEDDLQTAQYRALAAFQISPSNPEVLRASARLNARSGHPQTFAFYSALAATGKATEEDRLGYIEAALVAGEWEAAEAEIQRSEGSEALAPRLLELKAALSLARGDAAGAEQLWSERAALAPDDPQPKIELARLKLLGGDPAAARAAADLLEPLADHSAAAARGLLHPAIPASQRQQAAERLFSRADANAADRLAAAEVLLQMDPARREQLIPLLAERFPRSAPEDFRDFCAWLVRIGEFSAALDRLPLTIALQRKDYFLVWLDAEAGQGNWDSIQTVLSTRNPPLEPALVSLFLGRAAQELGEPDFVRYYEKALADAGRNFDLQLYLAAYFHRAGQPKVAERALRLLTLDPATAQPAYQSLLNQYREAGDTASVLATLREMAGRWPENAAVQNDLRYVELLMGERSLSGLLAESQAAFERDPGRFPFRMTYALALLKAGQAANALALFEDSAVQLRQLLPWQKAILAAILRAGGMADGAAAVAETIPAGSLSREEQRLISPE